MAALFGLLAAICFGSADFTVTHAARRIGPLQTLLYLQVFGLVAIGAVALRSPGPPSPTLNTWLLMGGVAVVNFAGTLLLYRAFAVGTLSIVSPIASGFAVVTALLAVASGERPPVQALGGVLLLVSGVTVVMRAPERNRSATLVSLAGVPEAMAVTLCFGCYFWAVGRLTPALGAVWPVLITRLVQLVCAAAVGSRIGLVPRPRSSTILVLIAAAVLDTAGLLAFSLGVSLTYVTVTTALTSLYSVVTVLLAGVLMRERLAPGQWLGIGVVLAGVLFVSL